MNQVYNEKKENLHDRFMDGDKWYFLFERDFVEENIRCIPMIVRFKLDACGIKLKLSEWSKFDAYERQQLCEMPCVHENEIIMYRHFLRHLVLEKTDAIATDCEIEEAPAWANTNCILSALQEQAAHFGWKISVTQWESLTSLQRFALLKLCRPGHENRNFPKAMEEFGLADQIGVAFEPNK